MSKIPPLIRRKAEYNIGFDDGTKNHPAKYHIISKLFHLEYFMGYDEGVREREEDERLSINKWVRKFPSFNE